MLLPLISTEHSLQLALVKENPPKVFVSSEDIHHVNEGSFYCRQVIRKGKQLAMHLVDADDRQHRYLLLHMGMTGRLLVPGRTTNWGHNDKVSTVEEFPPPYTYLTLQAGDYRVAFSDPRKFGQSQLVENLSSLDKLAPDALTCASYDPEGLVGKPTAIKAILLNQNRVVSGVGNWVADEVLYQIEMHPDQANLSTDQAVELLNKLESILQCAVECLLENRPYPSNWLFGYRWTKKKAGKDALDRSITFLTSAGRTSAIVSSIQKLYKRQKPASSPEKVVSDVNKPRQTKKRAAPVVTPPSEATIKQEESVNPRRRRRSASKAVDYRE